MSSEPRVRSPHRRHHFSPIRQSIPMKNTHQLPRLAAKPSRLLLRTVLSSTARHSLVLFSLLGSLLPQAQAAIPFPATQDPLYDKGYLVATYYLTNPNNATTTTGELNTALADAYKYNKILFLPTGTYMINQTLQAWTDTGLPDGAPGYTAPNPRNHIAIVGSTAGPRPIIKLAGSTSGFGDSTAPKVMLEFKNFKVETTSLPNSDPEYIGRFTVEQAGAGYHQMLRGVDLHCGSGNPGAIALYFNQAQDSSIEDVKITATGAYAGIWGLPARASVTANIEIIGGQYGIDTLGTNNPGSVIIGAKLSNQTVSAVRHDGFAPLTIVGFEIVTNSPMTAALTITPTSSTGGVHTSEINLIDGTIRALQNPTVAVIDNGAGKNFYARNVYIRVDGSTPANLIKSGTNPEVIGTYTWNLIPEYSYCNLAGPDNSGKQSYNLTGSTPDKAETVATGVKAGGTPPSDLRSRHVWPAKPSLEDPDAVDASTLGIFPGDVTAATFQAAIDATKKIFLPAGVYRLKGQIILRKHTILFGADRNLTRVEVASSWNNSSSQYPSSQVAMIKTDDDVTATTYLGDLSIGVSVRPAGPFDSSLGASVNDWFVALDWQAGRNSMVHTGGVYAQDEAMTPPYPTNAHSLLRIHNGGGGRWYGVGARKNYTSANPNFHILKVEGASEPLWIYGLNLEHPSGTSSYARFQNSKNIRIYCEKSEFKIGEYLSQDEIDNGATDDKAHLFYNDQSSVMTFENVENVALFGAGALRNSLSNEGGLKKGLIQFSKTSTGTMDRVLATMITPQKNEYAGILGPTLLERITSGGTNTERYVTFPDVVTMYKRGSITTTDEDIMTHDTVAYGRSLSFSSIAADDGWVLESAQGSKVGGSTDSTGKLRVGDDYLKKQYMGILSFDTSTIPAGATVVAATLKLRRDSVQNNISALGSLRVGIKKGDFDGNQTLQTSDFQASAFPDVVALFSIPATDGEWAVGTLVPSSLAEINPDGRTQFRVYFENGTNNNSNGDFISFNSGNDTIAAYRPVLEVSYRLN